MNNFTRQDYKGPVSQKKIKEISSENSNIGNGVKITEELKEYVLSKISGIGKIDSRKIVEIEREYIEVVEELEGILIEEKDKNIIVKDIQQGIEGLYKKQSEEYLGNKKGYIGDFNELIPLINKYVGLPRNELYTLLSNKNIPLQDRTKIKTFLDIIKTGLIKNTRRRELEFDRNIFDSNMGKVNNKDIKCFYEEDFNGNKNYFSFNTLINYINTFGIEIGLFEMNIDGMPSNIENEYFPLLNKEIKKNMYKTIVDDLINKQEVMIYGFTDYKLKSGIKNENKDGFIAEKIIELEFREMANIFNGRQSIYRIIVEGGTIGEDQQNKNDLAISLIHLETGVKVTDEIQITIKDNIELKIKQTEKRNSQLREKLGYKELELMNIKCNKLSNRINLWKYFNRPIGRIYDLIDNEEGLIIQEYLNNIIKSLMYKINLEYIAPNGILDLKQHIVEDSGDCNCEHCKSSKLVFSHTKIN